MKLTRGTCCWCFVRLLLLLSIALLLWALILSYGQFISSCEALISPFHFCLRGQDGVLLCGDNLDNASRAESNIPRVLGILSLYTPLVLLPFALMALQFALCSEEAEGGLLWFSLASQAASSLLILLGITTFMALHWAHVSLANMTAEFYMCMSVCVKLSIAAGLTWMSGRRLVMTEGKSEHVENHY